MKITHDNCKTDNIKLKKKKKKEKKKKENNGKNL